MEESELRIGNWVYLKSKNKWYQIGNGHDIDEGIDSDDFSPIPLTEEWLLKFGFVHDCATPDINFWIDMITHYLELRDFRDEWYPTYCQLPEMPNERTQRCGMNAIKYAHQLQNLYFALTGTELTISEK